MRIYIVFYFEDFEVFIDEFYIIGGGYFVFFQEVFKNDSMIMIGNIYGDRLGMLYIFLEQVIIIQEGDVFFFMVVRVYERFQVIMFSGE